MEVFASKNRIPGKAKTCTSQTKSSETFQDLPQAGVYVDECEARIHNSQFKVALKRFTATLSSNCGNRNESLRF